MREILFRGKAINRDGGSHRTNYKNGDWVYGLLTRPFNERYGLYAEMRNEGGIDGIEVDHETISQWTGLYDKKGKRIFEGDILQGDDYPYYNDEYDYNNYYAEVVWYDNAPAFGLITRKNPKSDVRGISDGMSYDLVEFESDHWLIIGNIYDNPELLGGDE